MTTQASEALATNLSPAQRLLRAAGDPKTPARKLREIVHRAFDATLSKKLARRALRLIAGNGNAPVPLLLALTPHAPWEVFKNPVFALHLMEKPDLWDDTAAQFVLRGRDAEGRHFRFEKGPDADACPRQQACPLHPVPTWEGENLTQLIAALERGEYPEFAAALARRIGFPCSVIDERIISIPADIRSSVPAGLMVAALRHATTFRQEFWLWGREHLTTALLQAHRIRHPVRRRRRETRGQAILRVSEDPFFMHGWDPVYAGHLFEERSDYTAALAIGLLRKELEPPVNTLLEKYPDAALGAVGILPCANRTQDPEDIAIAPAFRPTLESRDAQEACGRLAYELGYYTSKRLSVFRLIDVLGKMGKDWQFAEAVLQVAPRAIPAGISDKLLSIAIRGCKTYTHQGRADVFRRTRGQYQACRADLAEMEKIALRLNMAFFLYPLSLETERPVPWHLGFVTWTETEQRTEWVVASLSGLPEALGVLRRFAEGDRGAPARSQLEDELRAIAREHPARVPGSFVPELDVLWL